MEITLTGRNRKKFIFNQASFLSEFPKLSEISSTNLKRAKLYGIGTGATAGVDKDEEGRLTFNPERAVYGMVLGAAAAYGASRIGITTKTAAGKFMRGGKIKGGDPVKAVVPKLNSAKIIPEWDMVQTADEAVEYASKIKWPEPTVEKERFALRYRETRCGDGSVWQCEDGIS